jgi:hypothetical protein
MKECPNCSSIFKDESMYCPHDGTRLVRSVQVTMDVEPLKNVRKIPPPSKPLPLRLTIIDQSDEGHRSRLIDGLVLDLGRQGMRVQTGTIETGRLHIIRDHTVAFKNKLELEIDLPTQTIRCTGFAAWYRPEGEGLFWVVGVYIRDMSAADRKAYDEYLEELASGSERVGAPVL